MSMTHEEASRILDPETSAKALREYGGGNEQIAACDEACRIAADVLRNKPTREPLTLEQLRRMDGQPVWYKDKNQWFIVELHHPVFGSCVINSDGCYIPLEKAAKIGFYAYPIAHIDREAWTAKWKEYTGADAGFHYCSKCKQQAFNYEDGGEVVEVLSDFCPGCARAMTEKGLSELKKRMGLA